MRRRSSETSEGTVLPGPTKPHLQGRGRLLHAAPTQHPDLVVRFVIVQLDRDGVRAHRLWEGKTKRRFQTKMSPKQGIFQELSCQSEMALASGLVFQLIWWYYISHESPVFFSLPYCNHVDSLLVLTISHGEAMQKSRMIRIRVLMVAQCCS